MPYRVFETNDDGVRALEEDDLVNRQTIVIKDGTPWEVDGKVVIVEGSEEALERAAELVDDAGGQPADNAEQIKADIDAEDDAAAAGMGAIFG